MQEDVTIVIQARTSSTRFPGKVLVDFLGFPLAVLAAKRAGTRGHRVVLATSLESSDDALAEAASRHGIACIRGPLDDVLGRFVEALSACSDDETCVRLTADNICPDGDLITEVVSDFRTRNLDYLTTTDPSSGLPYGCSIEVTRVGLIRQAANAANSTLEREHVMPWIRAHKPVTVFTEHAAIGRSHFRCTVDCLDDYVSLIRSFPRDQDPVTVGWRELVAALDPGNGQPVTAHRLEKMVLGTAQFGMPYGIVRANEPDETESMRMIKHAIASGVDWLDTARAYGRSEDVIGKVMSTGWVGRSKIITKLSPMADCVPEDDPKLAAAIAENSLRASCMALECKKLDTVLLHRTAHLRMWNGRVLDVLRRWRSDGLLGTIGVSVQSPDELALSLQYTDIEHIQLPFNIMDHRWSTAVENLRAKRCVRKVVVHARSAFLQGLLLSDEPSAWARAHVSEPVSIRSWLGAKAEAMGYGNITAFCLAFVRSQDWIDGVVVGVDSETQLQQAISFFDQHLLSAQQIEALSQDRPILTPQSLDPSQWASKGGTPQ